MAGWAELLAGLEDEQIHAMLELGEERELPAGGVLLEEGQRVEELCLVLDGLLHVVGASAATPLAVLGANELVGEMSFVDPMLSAATATVVAREPTSVLALPARALHDLLEATPILAAAFYRALALHESRRLQTAIGMLRARVAVAAEGESEPIRQLRAGIDLFQELVLSYDKAVLADDKEAERELEGKVRVRFAELCGGFNQLAGDASAVAASVRQLLGHQAQRELLPYLLATETARRMYTKPRGYAGDFYTIELIYREEGQGTGAVGRLLDSCFQQEPAAQAVRNRRALLAREIAHTITQAGDRPVRIVSMACGPAREVFDVLEGPLLTDRLEPTLIDMDGKALEFVAQHAQERGLADRLRLERQNLVYLALGRARLDLEPQDLVYSIGLVDYFRDDLVIKLLDYAHSLLRPGGRVILGNFHPDNPTKALMDHVLEWRLIHRDEEDMNRLFAASRFGRDCTRILYEPQRINLFAECVK